MDEAKKPSHSRLGRTYRLARLATDTSARMAFGMAKKAVGSEDPEQPRSLEDHRKIAARAVQILGGMKGLAMKAGQIVSYVDDWIPEEVRPAYADLLPKLQAKAPVVPLADMLNVFIDEVGEPPDEVFKNFEDEPIAAASIGQVYRAELPSGERVAVKIQYPGIDKVIRSDLKNLDLLETVLRASTMGRFDVKQSLDDIKLKITEELDYRAEADHQRKFAEVYRDHPKIVIPKVYEDFSHARVLTTELFAGEGYYEFVARSDQEERNRTAATLYEFVFGSFHKHGMFNADPHPGNYIFLGDDRVAFLDFGCVQYFDLEVPGNFRRLSQAMWEGKLDVVREGLPAALGYPGEASEEEKTFFLDYVGYLWRPILEDREFTYDDGYIKEIFANTKQGVKLGAKMAITKGYPDTERRGLALLNRLQFGFMSILSGMTASNNYHRLIHDIFSHHQNDEDGGGPPSPTASVTLEVRERQDSERTCPYCREAIERVLETCSGCGAAYHVACWGELGGCATLGCSGQASGKGEAQARQREQVRRRGAIARFFDPNGFYTEVAGSLRGLPGTILGGLFLSLGLMLIGTGILVPSLEAGVQRTLWFFGAGIGAMGALAFAAGLWGPRDGE